MDRNIKVKYNNNKYFVLKYLKILVVDISELNNPYTIKIDDTNIDSNL